MQVPKVPGAQPNTYLHPVLGGTSGGVSNIDTDPLFAFGHGLSYTTFAYDDFALSAEEIATDGEVEISCVVANTGAAGRRRGRPALPVGSGRAGHAPGDLAARASRASTLEPGERARVTFTLHADRTAFTTVDLRRIVQAGEIGLALGASAADIRGRLTLQLVGAEREVGHDRVLTTPAGRSPA